MKYTDDHYFLPGSAQCARLHIDADGVVHPEVQGTQRCILQGPHPHTRTLAGAGSARPAPSPQKALEARALDTEREMLRAATAALIAHMALHHARGVTVNEAQVLAAREVGATLRKTAIELERQAQQQAERKGT